MADSKISALTADTSPSSSDLLITVDVSDTTMDVAGTDKKVTLGNAITKGHGLGNGLLKIASGAMTLAVASTDYEVPLTISTGLTRTTNTITVNTSQNIATLSNLTSNGSVMTTGGVGTLTVVANTGTGSNVLATSPTLVTPALGTPSALVLTNATGLPVTTGISATGTPSSTTYLRGDGSWATVSSGSSFTWNVVTGTTQTAAASNGYFANNAALVTVTLPATSAVGDTIQVAYMGAGGWKVAQPASNNITFGNTTTTTGTGGSLASTAAGDVVTLVCRVANTSWTVTSSVGNITVV